MFSRTVKEANLNPTIQKTTKQVINIESHIADAMFSRTP